MKKQVKKLVLSKETVRSLSTFDLREIAGGVTSATCNSCGARYCLPQINCG